MGQEKLWNWFLSPWYAEAYSEPSRNQIKLFEKIVTGFHPFSIFAKGFILDVRPGSEYASGTSFSTCKTHDLKHE